MQPLDERWEIPGPRGCRNVAVVTEFDAFQQSLLDTVPLPDGADIVAETVPYEHDGTAFEGVLVRDAARSEPLPTVVVVHDWFGVSANTRLRLHMYARLGYAAFAVDLFGAGIRPTTMDDAQAQARRFYTGELSFAERIGAGFDTVSALDVVAADRIVVLGYCFGGAGTLEFARTGAPARGFACFHGGLSTHDGEGIDRIAGSVLVMTGAEDPVVPADAVIAFQNELRGRPDLDWQVVTYAGAPHAFTVPGGNYRATADRRSWREIERFLAEVLAA